MSEPPPQYILPSAALPLAPARPPAPNNSGEGRRVVGPVREEGLPNIARTGAASATASPGVRASEAGKAGDGAAENNGAGENARADGEPAPMAAPSATGEGDPADVHIGPTGNPVGSIGYLASGALDGEGPALDLRAEGTEEDGVVDAGELIFFLALETCVSMSMPGGDGFARSCAGGSVCGAGCFLLRQGPPGVKLGGDARGVGGYMFAKKAAL